MPSTLRPDAPAWHPGQYEHSLRNDTVSSNHVHQAHQHPAQEPFPVPYHHHPLHGFHTVQAGHPHQAVSYDYIPPAHYQGWYQAPIGPNPGVDLHMQQCYPAPSHLGQWHPEAINSHDPFIAQVRQVDDIRSGMMDGYGGDGGEARGSKRGRKKTKTKTKTKTGDGKVKEDDRKIGPGNKKIHRRQKGRKLGGEKKSTLEEDEDRKGKQSVE